MKVRDVRRAALLDSLEELLRDAPLEAINIADISRRAGVTRSAFYFYFESKHLAVAALMEEVYDGAVAAAARLSDPTLEPRERIEAMVSALFDTVEQRAHLVRATLDARAGSSAVRQLWDADRLSFVDLVADLVTSERASGRAPDGPDPRVLATMLLELNDRAVERLSLGQLERSPLLDTVVTVWERSIFGTSLQETT